MHRTQVLLREEQYVALRDRAKTEGKSMGQVIRHFVDVGLGGEEPTQGQSDSDRLRALRGIVEDGGLRAADHDKELYGK